MTDPTSLPDFSGGLSSGEQGPEGDPGAQEGTPGARLGPDVKLRGEVFDVLVTDGLNPEIDEDGDIALTLQEQKVFIRCVESQPPLMRVFGQWLLDDTFGGDELTRLRASNVVTGGVNLVKVSIEGDRLSVAVDLVVAPGLELSSLLQATLEAVLGSVRTWHQVVTQLIQGVPADDGDPQPEGDTQ